ncbi:predicted protein [Naegleria gruberi]|uniref:Predicted protein n=1 Tax=Naegleria gruberi TaxID=5762 RepID=D2V1Q3_NAEGR|nr:uncharacterized protein NAEGRDRAFT_30356 [Naegleria gruberi]EFC49350.1 predicted protein [Naegleria gruberi]|eukprot:XP_002682094.1 predicted protein [Naegleria gruberi strain NEG-M]
MKTMTRIFGIMGIVTLVSGPFLIVVLEKEFIGMIAKHKIYRVKKIQFIPFKPSNFKSQTEELKEREIQYIEMMNRTIVEDNSFYMSYTLDLTHHLQHTFSTIQGLDTENLSAWRGAHNKYFWNRHMLQSLISKGMDGFIMPAIRGIVEIASCNMNGKVFTFGIVSRTSTKRAGTRYIMRGADENGYVANFVESEQFAYYDGVLSAFLQIRGSIPLIWTQEANLKYTPEIKFLTDKQKQQTAFEKHFQYILREYQNNITAVNLCKKTGQESKLSELYTSYVKHIQGVTYNHFDFHNECKNHDTTKLYTMFLPSIKDSMRNIKYFSCRLQEIYELQNGVFRVNCIDCCDRTNYIETFIAKYMMMEQLYRMGITKSRDDKMENYPAFDQTFRTFWINNGDRVSVLYSGTEALKFQKSAQGLMNDGFNSVKRYFLNNFKDSERQKAINLVLGLVDINSKEEQEEVESPAQIVGDLLTF